MGAGEYPTAASQLKALVAHMERHIGFSGSSMRDAGELGRDEKSKGRVQPPQPPVPSGTGRPVSGGGQRLAQLQKQERAKDRARPSDGRGRRSEEVATSRSSSTTLKGETLRLLFQAYADGGAIADQGILRLLADAGASPSPFRVSDVTTVISAVGNRQRSLSESLFVRVIQKLVSMVRLCFFHRSVLTVY